MQPVAQNSAPPVAASPPKRLLRNFLLDPRFQLKFASYTVALTIVVASLLGVFLYRTTTTLFQETDRAVDARAVAAEKSKEISNAILSNELMQHMADTAFEAQLKERSAQIDKAYEEEKNAVIEARVQLIKRQQITLIALIGGFVAFIIFIGLASIVSTHKIVGPLFRVKRMVTQVGEGKLQLPSYGLRPGDELKDVFEAVTKMITALRQSEQDDLRRVQSALQAASSGSPNNELIRQLQELEARLKAKLD